MCPAELSPEEGRTRAALEEADRQERMAESLRESARLASSIVAALAARFALLDETRPKPVDRAPFFQVAKSLQEFSFRIVKLPPE